MKLIKIFAIATVLAAAAMGQSNTGTVQPKATPTPTPAKGAAPAAAKGQTTTPAATQPVAKSAPATKTSAATKTSPGTAVKTGAITPAAATKTGATTPAAATKTGATTPAAATKTGTAAPPAKAAGSVQPATTTAITIKKAPATSDTKTADTKTPNTKKVATKTTPKTTAKKAVTKPATRPAKPVKAAVVESKTQAPPLEKKGPAKLMGAAGRRDPFISPIRTVSTGSPTGNCTSGKRCLAIPELVLQGTVRDISGKMMAIVVTSNRRTYTLRENDQVFNGSVEKITSDSIIFREFVRDAVGRESAKEVVKKLSPTS